MLSSKKNQTNPNKPTTDFIDGELSQRDSKPYLEPQKKTELNHRTDFLELNLGPVPFLRVKGESSVKSATK